MAERPPTKPPRVFFLNETHQLSPSQKQSMGALPKLAPINWAQKGHRVAQSLTATRKQLARSADPIASRRLFLVAHPEKKIRKISEAKGTVRTIEEEVQYRGRDAQVFSRLGMDLLRVLDNGDALVHMLPETADRLTTVTEALDKVGAREQARWISIHDFRIAPRSSRIDDEWLERMQRNSPEQTILELQPLLTRSESELVVHSIRSMLTGMGQEGQQRFVAAGTDYSGRPWFKCVLTRDTISTIAAEYASIQSIHEPLTSSMAANVTTKNRALDVAKTPVANLPCVGILDCGVPAGHLQLADYCRGRFAHPDADQSASGAHASSVASRVVFGDFDVDTEAPATWVGQCSYLDILISCGPDEVDDKWIVHALETARAAYPDVRVFSMSFSNHVPVAKLPPVARAERLAITQDIDNFIFFNDVVVSIAAGNVDLGQKPSPAYPQNHLDDDWHLGHLACSFNALTVGSFVQRPHPDGIASHAYAPSPFCKTGPGIAGMVGSDLSANGGDWNEFYRWRVGLGVSCLDNVGALIDRSGTSMSTPLVAREVALLLKMLSQYVDPDGRVLGVTAKAFLTLTASSPLLPDPLRPLAAVTLGHGEPKASRLSRPDSRSACFLWQGVLADHNEIIRVQLPMPLSWIDQAAAPVLEVCAAWDTPVNAVVLDAYGCREVKVHIRPQSDMNAEKHALAARRVTPARNHTYPLSVNRYDLKANMLRMRKKGVALDDVWTVEVQYSANTDYAIGRAVGPEQRVALALRLRDEAGGSTPYTAVELHPLARTMTRLSRIPIHVRGPIRVRG